MGLRPDAEELLDQRCPFAQYQWVTVTFDTVNADVVVPHLLRPPTPDAVRYIVAGRNAQGHVYHDTSPTRREWTSSFIVLRCSAVPHTTRLLLTVER